LRNNLRNDIIIFRIYNLDIDWKFGFKISDFIEGDAMAEQKQKLSRSRSRKRRGEDFIKTHKIVVCPKCKSKIPSHTVCPICGTYKKQQLVKTSTIKTKVTSKKAEKTTKSQSKDIEKAEKSNTSESK
jgi:large subunit ribosomal protein L32